MAENVQVVNMHDAVKGWAEVAIDKFHQALDDYEVGRLDGSLWNSLAYELVQNGGDIEAVIIKFKQYGRFVDMGAGRGTPVGGRGTAAFTKARKENGQLHKYGRKPKLWYSKTKYREVAVLRQILITKYGQKTLAEFESEFVKTEYINPL